MAPPAELGTAAIESVAPSTFPPSVSNGTVGIGALASRPDRNMAWRIQGIQPASIATVGQLTRPSLYRTATVLRTGGSLTALRSQAPGRSGELVSGDNSSSGSRPIDAPNA